MRRLETAESSRTERVGSVEADNRLIGLQLRVTELEKRVLKLESRK